MLLRAIPGLQKPVMTGPYNLSVCRSGKVRKTSLYAPRNHAIALVNPTNKKLHRHVVKVVGRTRCETFGLMQSICKFESSTYKLYDKQLLPMGHSMTLSTGTYRGLLKMSDPNKHKVNNFFKEIAAPLLEKKFKRNHTLKGTIVLLDAPTSMSVRFFMRHLPGYHIVVPNPETYEPYFDRVKGDSRSTVTRYPMRLGDMLNIVDLGQITIAFLDFCGMFCTCKDEVAKTMLKMSEGSILGVTFFHGRGAGGPSNVRKQFYSLMRTLRPRGYKRLVYFPYEHMVFIMVQFV